MTATDNLRKPEKKYKDPNAYKDYGVSWLPWLSDEDGNQIDTIATSTWSITVAPDAALEIDTPGVADPHTVIWVSGGTVGKTYWVTNHVVTIAGREDDQSIIFIIKEM